MNVYNVRTVLCRRSCGVRWTRRVKFDISVYISLYVQRCHATFVPIFYFFSIRFVQCIVYVVERSFGK